MKREKIVIVGTGMAGLTAGAYLTRESYEVLLIDRNDKVGGLVRTVERNGFSFDIGPRAFVNSGMIKPILKDLGIEMETIENKISIAIEDQMFSVDSMKSIKEYKEILLNLYPDKNEDIEKIMKSMERLSKYTQTLYAFDNPYFVDYKSDIKRVFTELLPWTFKIIYAMQKFDQFSLPMEEYMKDLTDSQSIIDILTQIYFKGTPTYFALGYFYVWLDYFYPKGGTGMMPDLLHKKILENGGQIKLNTRIKEVIPAEKKVVDSEGCQYDYDYLIWAADLKTLYKELNLLGLDQQVSEKIDTQKERVFKAKPAESNFSLNIAVNRSPSYFKERGGEHAFYSCSKQGLGDVHRERKEELLKNFDKKSKEEVFIWIDEFCKLNTYEVSVPALRDQNLAPKGQTGVMISCLFDYNIAEKIDQAGWKAEFKERMEDNIIKIFAYSFYKDLEKDILFKFSNTPLTIKNTLGSSGGSIVGWSFELESPVINNLKEMPKSALTPIPNVFQAGQWAYAPAGVPVAMLTGWHASQEIMKK